MRGKHHEEAPLAAVLQLLAAKERELLKTLESGVPPSDGDLRLKRQLQQAMDCLQFCSDHGLVGVRREVIEISPEGSDAYYTDYYLVDESALEQVDQAAIKQHAEGPLVLNCSDLILRTKA